jgi:hypothetical protein
MVKTKDGKWLVKAGHSDALRQRVHTYKTQCEENGFAEFCLVVVYQFDACEAVRQLRGVYQPIHDQFVLVHEAYLMRWTQEVPNAFGRVAGDADSFRALLGRVKKMVAAAAGDKKQALFDLFVQLSQLDYSRTYDFLKESGTPTVFLEVGTLAVITAFRRDGTKLFESLAKVREYKMRAYSDGIVVSFSPVCLAAGDYVPRSLLGDGEVFKINVQPASDINLVNAQLDAQLAAGGWSRADNAERVEGGDDAAQGGDEAEAEGDAAAEAEGESDAELRPAHRQNYFVVRDENSFTRTDDMPKYVKVKQLDTNDTYRASLSRDGALQFWKGGSKITIRLLGVLNDDGEAFVVYVDIFRRQEGAIDLTDATRYQVLPDPEPFGGLTDEQLERIKADYKGAGLKVPYNIHRGFFRDYENNIDHIAHYTPAVGNPILVAHFYNGELVLQDQTYVEPNNCLESVDVEVIGKSIKMYKRKADKEIYAPSYKALLRKLNIDGQRTSRTSGLPKSSPVFNFSAHGWRYGWYTYGPDQRLRLLVMPMPGGAPAAPVAVDVVPRAKPLKRQQPPAGGQVRGAKLTMTEK